MCVSPSHFFILGVRLHAPSPSTTYNKHPLSRPFNSWYQRLHLHVWNFFSFFLNQKQNTFYTVDIFILFFFWKSTRSTPQEAFFFHVTRLFFLRLLTMKIYSCSFTPLKERFFMVIALIAHASKKKVDYRFREQLFHLILGFFFRFFRLDFFFTLQRCFETANIFNHFFPHPTLPCFYFGWLHVLFFFFPSSFFLCRFSSEFLIPIFLKNKLVNRKILFFWLVDPGKTEKMETQDRMERQRFSFVASLVFCFKHVK